MRFELSHAFPGATAREVEELYLRDDAFNAQVFASLRYDREVIEQREEGGRLVRCLRVRSQTGVPAPFAAIASTAAFYFDEHTNYDVATRRGTWRTVPSVLERQFASSGEFAIVEEPGSVRFVMTGDTTVRIPLVGGRAAAYAVETAQKSHAAIAAAVRERLATNRAGEAGAYASLFRSL